jgi:PAS domain-containing protein
MRYFFHFLAGDTRLDDDLGLENAGSAAAKIEAVRAAREMMADLLRRNEPVPADGVIEITDERGQLIDQVSLPEAAFGVMPETRYRRIFDHVPQNYLLLTPDLTIIEANRAYLQATMTSPGLIARRPLFDVFPDNPGDPEANGVRNLSASLAAVLRDRCEHAMPVQRYDIRRPDGAWEMRYWKPRNVPILNVHGDVEFIVHHVQDVTLAVLRERSRAD